MTTGSKHTLRYDAHSQTYLVTALAKCQAPDLVPQLCNMLQYALMFTDYKIYEDLWVIGDARAEKTLIYWANRTTSNKQQSWYKKHLILRALGTCGEQRGARALLDFLRAEQQVLIELPEECICPFVRRGYLNPKELTELASDTTASSQGRAAAVLSLALLDASQYKDMFLDLARQTDDHNVQSYAVRMLRFTKDASVVPTLRRVLLDTSEASIAEEAALGLAAFEVNRSVAQIEAALAEFADTSHANGFVEALGHFRAPSSLRYLLAALQTRRYARVEHEIVEALGAFWSDPAAKKVIMERLEPSGDHHWDMSRQVPAIRALVRHDPNYLLSHVITLYDQGHLERSSRKELAGWVTFLSDQAHVSRGLLLELLTRLASDLYLPIRDRLGQFLPRIEHSIQVQLYDALEGSLDEWQRACAVYVLGFLQTDEALIQRERFSGSPVVRYLADAALQMRLKRKALEQLVGNYLSPDGRVRLAAYISIKQQGDEHVVWSLRETLPEGHIGRTFLNELQDDVRKRLDSERKKHAEEEDKMLAAYKPQ